MYDGEYNGDKVAVKVFKRENDKEIRVCSHLGDHPYVMKAYGYSVKQKPNPSMYGRERKKMLVMKKYEDSMQKYLRVQGGKLTVKDLKKLLVKIAKGVEYLESKGIVHRDLKVLAGTTRHS